MHLTKQNKRQTVVAMIALFFSVSLTHSWAQGCSDAGACTIPAFLPDHEAKSPFQLDFRTSLEGSEPGALIISPQLWFHFRPTEKFRFDVKLPLWFVNDPELGEVAAFSDPIVSLSWLVHQKNDFSIDVSAGMRIGVNNANLMGELGDLPMDYQSSLGTTDLIIGGKFGYKGFSGTIALQMPVWQYNMNQNVVAKYVEFYDDFPFTFEYQRMSDLVFRVDHKWALDHWFFQVGILPIYHLADDKIVSRENTGEVIINGSKGMTVNIPFSAFYQLNNWTFGIQGGFPILVRDERPDGLTRRYVLQPTITLNL